MTQLLGDPKLDRMMMVMMRLARELYVTRDRLRVVEKLLEQHGALTYGAIEKYEPDPGTAAQIDLDRDAFISDILEPLTHDRVID